MKYEKEREYNVILIEIERNLYNRKKIVKQTKYNCTNVHIWFGKFTYVVCILILKTCSVG